MRSVLLIVFALLAAAAPANAATVERRAYANGYHSVVYTPTTLDRSRPAPLVVFLHGCNQTAEHIHAEGDLGAQAEAGGFVALYADFDASRRSMPCWNFRSDTVRSSGDPAAVAAMVADAVARRAPVIDPARVYAAGLSSGAMMTSVLGATYPDVFAAIAVDAGCAYRAVTCINAGPSRSSDALAREAVRAMGARKRVLPVLILHGDQDVTVPVAHADQLVEQWRRTANLVAPGRLPASPTRVRTLTAAGGFPSTVTTFDDARGQTVIERWTLHGVGHDWLATDERPGSAAAMWSFFSRTQPVASTSRRRIRTH